MAELVTRKVIRISVRNLVEFVLQAGDLVSVFVGSSRALEGTKAHKKIQNSRPDEYYPEFFLSHTFIAPDLSVEVSGRADGIYILEDRVIVDEIKTTTRMLEYINDDNPLHWAQAKCYAYIYAMQEKLSEIEVQLTYYQLDTKEMKYFNKIFTFEDLEEFFIDLISRYLDWAKIIQKWQEKRDQSIKSLNFPFSTYRKGQRELAVYAYRAIAGGNKLFAQAPTGIGKTIATTFPAVKAMGEGHIEKIFYLTAKTITRENAEKAFVKMRRDGLALKPLTLTAKEKICFNNGAACTPDECEFAKGYYDRLHSAIKDIFNNEDYVTRQIVEDYARKYEICPFEFSLDLSLWVDCIICDYNYAFDPSVYLRRFFADNSGEYGFLIDEAHNLVDRAREMFSAVLTKRVFLELKRATKQANPKLSKNLGTINSYMAELRKVCTEAGNGFFVQKELVRDIIPLLRRFITLAEQWLVTNEQADYREALLDLYFEVTTFLRVSETYDKRFVTYVEEADGDLRVRLFCVDPSQLLKEAIKRGKSALFFSATLTPLDYFFEVLGGEDEDLKLRVPSPFPRDNLCLLVADNIATTYKLRESTYEQVVDVISEVVGSRKGNYLIYLPSYKYMNEVSDRYRNSNPDVKVMIQNTGMTEEEKEIFLGEFLEESNETLVGFAVMGGVFGEGIDLAGDRLSGSVIVGVGLPQICLERDIIRDYFDETKGTGFEYAYVYPGMNKVLQAAGRVIRTETDRGTVVLIDERFSHLRYKKLFPLEWQHAVKVKSKLEIKNKLDVFWAKNRD